MARRDYGKIGHLKTERRELLAHNSMLRRAAEFTIKKLHCAESPTGAGIDCIEARLITEKLRAAVRGPGRKE
jgi:hypothetical protein